MSDPRFTLNLICAEEGQSHYNVYPQKEGVAALEVAQHLSQILSILLSDPTELILPVEEAGQEEPDGRIPIPPPDS